ncbi:MAG: hypothetical protein MZU97_21325 [Bacillus subtilis]|nr:hypothetical protein [Bacillus subtilis]
MDDGSETTRSPRSFQWVVRCSCMQAKKARELIDEQTSSTMPSPKRSIAS